MLIEYVLCTLMSVKGTYVGYLSFSGNEGFMPKYSHYKRPPFPLEKKTQSCPRKRSNVAVCYVATFPRKKSNCFFVYINLK